MTAETQTPETASPAEAVSRAQTVIAAGTEADPTVQPIALAGLHGFKRGMAEGVNAFHAYHGDPNPTPGAAAYHSLAAKVGLPPGHPDLAAAFARMTGLA